MTSTLQFKTSQFFRLSGLLVLAVWLSGCATAKPVPSDDGLIVSDISPDTARQNDSTGSIVRWGGTIAGISNLADGTTAIELVSRPLSNGGRPVHNDTTEGRFIAEIADFLDPEIIKVGRDFTLVGTVVDVREGKVGEAEYHFPVVAVDNYRYWSKQRVVTPRHFRHWSDYPPRYYDPFWRDWPFHRDHRFRQRRSGVSASFIFIQ